MKIKSIKTQLILGITITHMIMMTIITIENVKNQSHFLDEQTQFESEGLTRSLAQLVINPVLNRDFAALDEILASQGSLPNVDFIQVKDSEKIILSQFNRNQKNSEWWQKEDFVPDQLNYSRDENYFYAQAPVLANGKLVGQIELAFNLKSLKNANQTLITKGVIFAIVSTLFGSFLAFIFAKVLGRQLDLLRANIIAMGNGNNDVRADESATNEIGELAKQFNIMSEKISQLQKSMVSSVKMSSLGEMAGGIAHEINTPLAIIQGKASLVLEKINKGQKLEDVTSDLQKIINTTVRIARIVKSMKLYSRSGEKDPFTSVLVEEIIQSSLDLCSEKLKLAQIEVRVISLPTTSIQARPTELVQVLTNLINNSFDAIKDLSQKWIELEARQIDEQVLISVTDSGNGIEPKVVEKMMDPFYTTKAVGVGTGLGLSLSKGIIESHSGRLFYDASHPHTRFVITLPKDKTALTSQTLNLKRSA